MAWTRLTVKLTVSGTRIEREGGRVIATVTVSGTTDGDDESNSCEASLRDDHLMPDILWKSGPITVGPAENVRRVFETALTCDRRGKVVGPAGSSHQKTANVYARVISAELESQSPDIPVSCA